jgi:hypothetical protein
MNRSTPASPDNTPPIDLALIAQRILKLAEISVLEHLDALKRSQAVGLSDMLHNADDDTLTAQR